MKSLLSTTNTTSQSVEAGNKALLLGNISRKYGQGISAVSSGIVVTNPGYYSINVDMTFTGTAGNAIVDIYQDGVVVGSASVTIGTANTEIHSVSMIADIRVSCCQISNIYVAVDPTSTSDPTISRLQTRIVKL